MDFKQKLLGLGASATALATSVNAAYTGSYTFSDISALAGDFIGNLFVGMIGEADTLGELTIIVAVLVMIVVIITAVITIVPKVLSSVRRIKQ